jgi:hypothetical protein
MSIEENNIDWLNVLYIFTKVIWFFTKVILIFAKVTLICVGTTLIIYYGFMTILTKLGFG